MTKPIRVSTCFWFNAEAEAAATFYTSLLDNSRIVHVSRYGAGAPLPEGTAIVVAFELAGVPFHALNVGSDRQVDMASSIMVHCETQAEIDRIWSALTADGGTELQCGWLRDRFAIAWQIVPNALSRLMTGEDPAASARTMAALRGMVKLDIAALEAAHRGTDFPAGRG